MEKWSKSPGEWETDEEGEGEYCLESGQVLLEHVTCSGGENGYLGSLSQLQLGTAGTNHGRWAG